MGYVVIIAAVWYFFIRQDEELPEGTTSPGETTGVGGGVGGGFANPPAPGYYPEAALEAAPSSSDLHKDYHAMFDEEQIQRDMEKAADAPIMPSPLDPSGVDLAARALEQAVKEKFEVKP